MCRYDRDHCTENVIMTAQTYGGNYTDKKVNITL